MGVAEGLVLTPPSDRAQLPESRVAACTGATAKRRGIAADPVLGEALDWTRRWWGAAERRDEAPDALADVVAEDAVHYAVWHRVGPEGSVQPGFLALHRVAIREARGDVDRGSEAATDTWLDVRDRLDNIVARAVEGRSVPDFRGPGAAGEDNCHRYHGIQARLRVAGKWSHERAHETYEEGRHAAEWRQGYDAVEARTYGLPLHFAAWWTVLDARERRTRDGRVKGAAWWWEMLLHALDLRKIADLGGDRNDPTEALLRMRLRFAVAQGLAGWLRRWSASHPYWSQVEFGLPDPDNGPAREAALAALDLVRPAIDAAIDAVEASDAERKALRGTLMRGENVRTSTSAMAGGDATARQERMFALGHAVGRDAADRLGGGGDRGRGGGGGGGTGRHQHADALIASLATGATPTPEQALALRDAVRDCEACRDRWVAQVDAGPYLAAAASAAPAPTANRRAWVGATALLATAAAALWIAMPRESAEIGLRGGEAGPPEVAMDLFVVPVGGETAERAERGRVYHPGDTLYFRVSAGEPAEVRVRVEGPGGAVDVGAQQVGAEGALLGDGAATRWYRFDAPGTYVVRSSAVPGEGCEAPGCVERIVEVTP